jgi:hypothetical protein
VDAANHCGGTVEAVGGSLPPPHLSVPKDKDQDQDQGQEKDRDKDKSKDKDRDKGKDKTRLIFLHPSFFFAGQCRFYFAIFHKRAA